MRRARSSNPDTDSHSDPDPDPEPACGRPDFGGNTFSSATAISSGQPVEEFICPSGDVDWFKLPIEGSQEVSVYLYDLPQAPDADLDVFLVNPSGGVEASSEVYGAHRGGYINHTAHVTGDWRVMVKGKGVADWSPTKTYGLRVDVKFNCDFPDEAGDTFQAATAILPSLPAANTIRKHTGYICAQKDVDYYKISVPSGQTVTIETNSPTCPPTTICSYTNPTATSTPSRSTAAPSTKERTLSRRTIRAIGGWRSNRTTAPTTTGLTRSKSSSRVTPISQSRRWRSPRAFRISEQRPSGGRKNGGCARLRSPRGRGHLYLGRGGRAPRLVLQFRVETISGFAARAGAEGSDRRETREHKTTHHHQELNFFLPKSWTTAGNITLKATVNPRHTIPESNYNNNDLTDTITIRNNAALNVGLVPVKTKGLVPTLRGSTDLAQMMKWLRASYPVGQINIWHIVGTYEMDHDLTEDSDEGCGPGWVDLLADLEDRYDGWTNRPPNALVYGLIDLAVPANAGGCGSSDRRSAASYLDPGGGSIIAHEIGHIYFRNTRPAIATSVGR